RQQGRRPGNVDQFLRCRTPGRWPEWMRDDVASFPNVAREVPVVKRGSAIVTGGLISLAILCGTSVVQGQQPAKEPVRPSPQTPTASLPSPLAETETGSSVAQPVKATLPRQDLPGPDSIKPAPLVAIPDEPPPHEGAFFDIPYIIDAPDLLIVEVL